MILANNIVRINGYKNNKRTHIDIEVHMKEIRYTSAGRQFNFLAPCIPYDIAEVGFNNGLDAVTSYNAYNWCSNCRQTNKII